VAVTAETQRMRLLSLLCYVCTMSVTGTMLAPTDDSSDSESDDELLHTASAQAAVPRLDLSKLISQHADDDDADIEYGDGAVLKRSEPLPAKAAALAAANTAVSTATPNPRVNLIDAMAEAVEEIEAELQGRLFVTPPSAAASNANTTSFSKALSSNDKMAAAASNPTVQQQPVDDGDAFGIAYRPVARLTSSQQQGYSIPSGPAFADEREFETELSGEFALTSATAARNDSKISIPTALRNDCNDDDDEFDFDDNCAVVSLAVQQQSTFDGTAATVVDINAVQQHLQTAEQLSAIDATDPLALCDTTASIADAVEAEPAFNLEMLLKGVKSSSTTGTSGSLNALDTLKSMYATTTDASDAAANSCTAVNEKAIVDATAETNAVKTECIVSQVIDEGDEDDIEVDETEPFETAIEVEVTELEQPEPISAADEWSAIEALQQQQNQRSASFNLNSSSSGSTKVMNDVNTAAAAGVSASLLRSNISVKEALKQLRQVDMSSYRALIVPTEFSSSKGFTLLQKIPVLRLPNADVQRDEVFLLAQVHYNPEDTLHQRLLQTVYRAFTGNSTEICIPNTGTHWEAIGFQGIDPCTDLNRSQGILSILQVMMFIEQQPEYAAAIHRASAVNGVLGWPFMCVAIGFTKEAVGVLRRGACYTECNACSDSNNAVMTVLAQIQQAQFHDFNTRCKAAPSVHHAIHLAKTRECILKAPNKLLKAYSQYLSKSSSSRSGGGAGSGSSATTATDSSLVNKYLSPCDKDSSVSNDNDNFGSSSDGGIANTAAPVHQRLRAYKV
jgi:ELMO/CED-12 family